MDSRLSRAAGTMMFALSFLAMPVCAATPSSSLLKAKQDAEAKGYIFETSHDEIVAKAKKEG